MYKLIKFAISSAITSLKFSQFCLMLLALLTMVDFVLSLMTIKLPSYIQIVFDYIYAIQNLIYKPDLSIIPVDFTLAVAAIEMLIMAGLFVYVINFIIEFEQVLDKVQKDSNRRFEQKFNKQLEKNAVKIQFYDLSTMAVGQSVYAASTYNKYGRKVIYINSIYKDSPVEQIACLIAHESCHVLRHATLDEESVATQKEAACWTKYRNNSVTYPQNKLTKRCHSERTK